MTKKCSNCGFVRLADYERAVFDFVTKRKSVGVFDVAKEFDYTLAAASTVLRKLTDAGVIHRSRRSQKKRYRPNCFIYEPHDQHEHDWRMFWGDRCARCEICKRFLNEKQVIASLKFAHPKGTNR